MDEQAPQSRVTWIVGLVLATAFVATIIWSVARDDDSGAAARDQGADTIVDPTTTTFDETAAPIVPPGSVVIPEELRPDEPLDAGMYTLRVHDDGCGVIRTTRSDEPRGLTWVVKDEDGFEVLGRAAESEDRYRYFQSGTYTVVLQAYGAGSYEDVSNTVTVTC